MLPGFRYHVVTIAAIFLALGVGIIVGSSFVRGEIVNRQAGQLQKLAAQFTTEVVPVREQNRRYAEFVAALDRSLVEGRLQGERVALIQTGDYPEVVQAVRDLLERAGAQTTGTLTIPRLFDAALNAKLERITSRLRATHPLLEPGHPGVLRVLAEAVARGGREAILKTLEEENLIEPQGAFAESATAVILAAGAREGFDNRAATLDLPLIEELKALGARVIAVEPEDADISCIPELSGRGIVTVDNVDSDLGRVSLALALNAPPGDYGVKRTARSGIVPPLTR